jgi:hypothetical protein
MILFEKFMNIQVVQLIKIYNFYFSYFFIRQSHCNIDHKFYISLTVYETLIERCKIYEQFNYQFVG